MNKQHSRTLGRITHSIFLANVNSLIRSPEIHLDRIAGGMTISPHIQRSSMVSAGVSYATSLRMSSCHPRMLLRTVTISATATHTLTLSQTAIVLVGERFPTSPMFTLARELVPIDRLRLDQTRI